MRAVRSNPVNDVGQIQTKNNEVLGISLGFPLIYLFYFNIVLLFGK